MNASPASRNILVIHGPNLNMLGKREPEVYGRQTLADINGDLKALAADLGVAITCFQSNHEGEIVERIHAAMGGIQGLIINPGAYTHTSVAIRDALQMLSCPIVEVHISNVYRREAFRHKSLISDVATGKIVGLGAMGYRLALTALAGMDPK